MSETPPIPLFREDTRVLVPLQLPDPEPVSPWLRSFLDDVRVHLLGCYVVPDQTSPEQARGEFDAEATAMLEEIAGECRAFSSDVESSLVFTPDVVQTVERVAEELDVDAIVQPREVAPIRSVLAVITRAIDYDRFVKCVSALVGPEIERLKVVQVGDDGEAPDEQELMLDGIRLRLLDQGMAEEVVETEALATDEPTETVLTVAEAFDVVIAAEREPTLTDRLAGQIAEEIFEHSDAPVVLVRLPE